MKSILLIFILFFTTYSFSQSTENKVRRIGENGEKIIIVDSLSFLNKNLSSEFFILEKTNKPYTGIVVAYYSDKGIDTLNIVNGLKNGWQRKFGLKEGSISTMRLFDLDYYNQDEKFWVSNFRSGDGKLNMYVKVDDECKTGFYEIVNHKNKIKLKKTLTTVTGKKIFKHKMYSIKEFEQYMMDELGKQYFFICLQAYFFVSVQQFGTALGDFAE